MSKPNPLPGLIFVVIFAIGLILAYPEYLASAAGGVIVAVLAFIVALIVSYSIKIADQWQKVIVLRLGAFARWKGRDCSSSFRLSRRRPIGSTQG